jgi:4-hydroxy-3-methylbut-2-enyl diphosphate reductase
MKILLAQHFGICFGVRDAIAQAEQLAAEAPLTILGELVHNPLVRERLRAQGVQESSLDAPPDGVTQRVMITAHGAADAKRAAWRAAGFNVADGTCPLVRHAHEQLRHLVAAGFFPVVIGQQGHVEVEGLIGDFEEAVVLSSVQEVLRLPTRARYGVISQTTQPINFVQGIVAAIRQAYPKAQVRFVDTVCKPTKDRQSALQKLIAQADTVVVVGGRESNNTRQLVAACRGAGRRAIHIERPEELEVKDFEGVATVGLTAGTSTMPQTVEAVFKRLQEISSAQLKSTIPPQIL